MLTIDKDRPVPPELLLHKNRKYPFLEMAVGDSILLKTPAERDSARAAWHQMKRRKNLKWEFRTLRSIEESGWRMWRID